MKTRLIILALVLATAGCASVKVNTSATPATVEKLRAANLAPMQIGTFTLAPGKAPTMDTTLGGLRGSSLAPAKGTWSQFLKDTLIAELTASGLYDPASSSVVEGQLTDSRVDAAIGTGTGRLAARFMVTKAGRVVFDKELAVDSSWDSSFVGAIAIPLAMDQYSALYKSLVLKLVDDQDFRKTLSK